MTDHKRVKHVIAYSAYWRCDCKPCTYCGIRPLTDFHRKASRPCGYQNVCKRCTADRETPTQAKRRKQRNKIWATENPTRIKAAHKRYAQSEKGRLKRKLTKIAYENQNGTYWLCKRAKSFRGFCGWMRAARRRTYGRYTPNAFWWECAKNKALVAAYKLWKANGMPNKLRPVLMPGQPQTAQVLTYGEYRARVTKLAWRRGRYAKKVENYRRAIGYYDADGRSKQHNGGSSTTV